MKEAMGVLVVKIGGGRGNRLDELCKEVKALWEEGERLVLVHGVSDAMDARSAELGLEPRYLVSPSGFRSRFVGERERDVYLGVCLEVGARICSTLHSMRVRAVALWGGSGALAEGERKEALRYVENGKVKVAKGNWSGVVRSVNARVIEVLLEGGFLPVVSPVAVTPEGLPLNVDGDRMAAAIASALRAEALVILSNVPGLLERLEDPGSLVRRIPFEDLEDYEGLAKGNMKRKLLAAREAVEGGVEKVIISDSRVERPIGSALAGGGTWICRAF